MPSWPIVNEDAALYPVFLHYSSLPPPPLRQGRDAKHKLANMQIIPSVKRQQKRDSICMEDCRCNCRCLYKLAQAGHCSNQPLMHEALAPATLSPSVKLLQRIPR